MLDSGQHRLDFEAGLRTLAGRFVKFVFAQDQFEAFVAGEQSADLDALLLRGGSLRSALALHVLGMLVL